MLSPLRLAPSDGDVQESRELGFPPVIGSHIKNMLSPPLRLAPSDSEIQELRIPKARPRVSQR